MLDTLQLQALEGSRYLAGHSAPPSLVSMLTSMDLYIQSRSARNNHDQQPSSKKNS